MEVEEAALDSGAWGTGASKNPNHQHTGSRVSRGKDRPQQNCRALVKPSSKKCNRGKQVHEQQCLPVKKYNVKQ